MTNNSYSPTATYYLVCDPANGEVVLRTHQWHLQLAHYHQIKVTRAVWRQHRSGDRLNTAHIQEPELGRWIRARAGAALVDARS